MCIERKRKWDIAYLLTTLGKTGHPVSPHESTAAILALSWFPAEILHTPRKKVLACISLILFAIFIIMPLRFLKDIYPLLFSLFPSSIPSQGIQSIRNRLGKPHPVWRLWTVIKKKLATRTASNFLLLHLLVSANLFESNSASPHIYLEVKWPGKWV